MDRLFETNKHSDVMITSVLYLECQLVCHKILILYKQRHRINTKRMRVLLTAISFIVFISRINAECKLDLGIILDKSSYVGSDFQSSKTFVKSLIDNFKVGNSDTLISIITYANYAQLNFRFRDYAGYSKTGFQNALYSMNQEYGWAYVIKALQLAQTSMFSSYGGQRHDAKKVLLVVTNGKSGSYTSSIKTEINKLKSKGVHIYGIGVGDSINFYELQALASDSQKMFQISTSAMVTSVTNSIKNVACSSVTCSYKECFYSSWSTWSSTCGKASRTRKLENQINRQKTQTTGCSGLQTSCQSTKQEQKDMGSCRSAIITNCKLDLGVILDESSSIFPSTNFRKETDFVRSITNELVIGIEHTLVSVMTFSTYARMKFKFRDYQGYSKTGLHNALRYMVMTGGDTATEKALDTARTKMFASGSGQRYGVSKVLLVITDGKSQAGPSRIKQSSDLLINMGINIFAIGIGNQINSDELKAIASNDQNIFRVDNLGNLQSIVENVRTVSCTRKSCAYVECSYEQWTSWSGTCGSVSRSRRLINSQRKQRNQNGGCAGLRTTCHSVSIENKNLVKCPSISVPQCKLDLGVILDESTSIQPRSLFRKETEFIKDLTNYLTIGKDDTLVSVMTFSTNPRLKFKFVDTNGQSKYTLDNTLRTMTMIGGNTATEKALDMARTNMFSSRSGQRNEVSKVLIVVTDGNSQVGPVRVKQASDMLAEKGVNIFAVGVGSKINVEELKAIASDDHNIFRVGGLMELSSIVQHVRTASCESVTCQYKLCHYYNWGSWSGTCGSVTRSKSLYQAYDRSVKRTGGCAGLSTSCHQVLREGRTLRACQPEIVKCKYYMCNWGSWTQYTATCGANIKRQRLIVQTERTDYYYNRCPSSLNFQSCSKTPQIQSRNIYCPCKIDTCTWYQWSSWSATCGQVTRTRRIYRYHYYQHFYNCTVPQETYGCKIKVNVATQAQNIKPCHPTPECKLDLGVILDESTSIHPLSLFRKETNFIKDLTTYLSIGVDKTLVSVITFSTDPRLRFQFRDFRGYSKPGLHSALDQMNLYGGNTGTEKALNLARTHMYQVSSGMRPGISKVLIVVTDGKSQAGPTLVQKASQKLAAMGINIYAVGIGSNINENELRAIATERWNIFQVGNFDSLNKIVNSVRKTSCTAINCPYQVCSWYGWSSWSSTCDVATRRRYLFKAYNRITKRYGGCAGVIKTCKSSEQETKTLQACRNIVVTCNNFICNWGSWSQFSATCGSSIKRQRYMIETKKVEYYYYRCPSHLNTNPCSKTPMVESKSVYCPCKIKKCAWDNWSVWTATCDNGTRHRQLRRFHDYQYFYDCQNAQNKYGCKEKKDIETQSVTKIPCLKECESVLCSYNVWSSWSSSCGLVSRFRTVNTTKVTVQRTSCDELTQTCSAYISQVERKSVKCVCSYVECKPGKWSEWSKPCGHAVRQRSIAQTSKQIEKERCDGLPQTCEKFPVSESLVTLCECSYVECKPSSWSHWSTTCGEGTRSRKLDIIRKTAYKTSCEGLEKQCPKETEIEERSKLCTCTYVECVSDSWSSWSASCGESIRKRNIKVVQKTMETHSCDGLLKTCPAKEEVQSTTKLCECHYVTCQAGVWSDWSSDCGEGVRTRNIKTIQKTIMKGSCDGLQTTCPKSQESESRSKKCICSYIECITGTWSEWSSECGKGFRNRPINVLEKTVEKYSCDGLTQTCKEEDVEERNKLCECKYVKCVAGEWTKWTSECGKAKRTRTINAIQQTILKSNCEQLPLKCKTAEDTEERDHYCPPGECKYVECVPKEWSSWNTHCGKGTRTRSIQAVEKTIYKYNCEGLNLACPRQEKEERMKLCDCEHVECLPQPWKPWNKVCGEAERTREVKPVKRIASLASCDGLRTSCSKQVEKEKRKTLCQCNFVECQPQSWSDWSQECGPAERTRPIRMVQKTVERYSCDGLLQKCEREREVEERNKLCECHYVECIPGSWSAWSSSCSNATRSRIINAVAMTDHRETCSGLMTSCPSTEEHENQYTKCNCSYVECKPGSWSSWSTQCGNATRTRSINAHVETIQKYSCDGLQQTCSKSEETEHRLKLCDCEYVDCIPKDWSEWSAKCGNVTRSRIIQSVGETVKRTSCDGLPSTCSKTEETEEKRILCNCTYVECEKDAWTQWSSDCGTGQRKRVVNAKMNSVEKYDCSGLQQTCPTSEEVEERKKLCDCEYVECLPGVWSDWSAECGEISRTRLINVISKVVKKANCDGLQKTCPKTEDTESKETMCSCPTIACNWAAWSVWSKTCGEAVRTRLIVGTLTTVQKLSCKDVKKTCAEQPETQKRNFQCDKSPTVRPTETISGTDTCHIKYRSLGCFHDDMKSPRPLPELILTERDPTHRSWNGRMIDWKNWDSYHVGFICRCAAKAKELHYRFFSAQFFGECWSGPEAGDTYNRNGAKDYKHCVKGRFKQCQTGDLNCVGKKETNFVFELTM